MTPDAKLRMEVYQEGQRAYCSGATCPYSDWRASTWAKGRAAGEAYYKQLVAADVEVEPDPFEDLRSLAQRATTVEQLRDVVRELIELVKEQKS